MFQYSGGMSSVDLLLSFHLSSSSDDVATSVESESSLSAAFLVDVKLFNDDCPDLLRRLEDFNGRTEGLAEGLAESLAEGLAERLDEGLALSRVVILGGMTRKN